MVQDAGAMPKQAEPIRTIAIILGSESDWPKVEPVITAYTEDRVRIVVHIVSCHRNPIELLILVGKCCWGCYNVVICCGGKAFALPGVLEALIHFFNGKTPVVGVALGESIQSDDGLAARLSIKEIPGKTVVMCANGEPYWGPEGLRGAIEDVIAKKLIMPKAKQPKPARWDYWSNFKQAS